MKLTMAFLFLSLLTKASSCKKPDKAYHIYLVPIGDASSSDIDGLVDHYRQKFGLESSILPALKPGPSEKNPDRHQLIAENVLDSMHKTYSRYIENNSSILIGITSDDMYPLGQDWRFCFGWRQTGIRSAVVSTARIDLTGLPPQVSSLSFHLVQKRPVRSRARDTRLSSTLEYALYYLRPPICHELH
jgi:predicted Zn-dependent protease